MVFNIPKKIQTVLDKLHSAGFRALPVGGCVRDLLRGIEPHDWDITTSATPDEMLEVFKDYRLAPISSGGIKHGTVTVILDHQPIEITSFRCDGKYSDGRRPDSVGFSRNLEDDLSRRDFTVNALCIDENGQIVDMFGGCDDLKNGIIRAIGDPDRRFNEDALRILRALRFSASFGFEIEPTTSESMLRNFHRLELLARERIGAELVKLICAPHFLDTALKYKQLLCMAVPELAPMVGMYQREDYHCYDVYEHTVRAVAAVPAAPVLRWTMLLHDIGKPACSDGQGHFHRHESVGVPIAEQILKRFNCGRAQREQILTLIAKHCVPLSADRMKLKKQLAKYGENTVLQLIEVKRADCIAQRPEITAARLAELEKIKSAVDAVISEKPALTLSQLAVSGKDLISAGFEPSPEMGKLLNRMLELVIAEKLPNEREILLDFARNNR